MTHARELLKGFGHALWAALESAGHQRAAAYLRNAPRLMRPADSSAASDCRAG